MNILSVIVAVVAGVLSGWGIGGGSLLLVYMTAVSGIPRLTAASVNLLYFFPTAGGSLIGHIRNRQINWRAVWPAVCAGIVTATVFALLSNKLDGVWLRRVFGAFLCCIGVTELCRKPVKKNNKKQ